MRRVLMTAIAAVTVLAFGFFVWPTPWTYYHFAQLGVMRVERWSGRVQAYDADCGWISASAFANRASASDYVNGCPVPARAANAAPAYTDPFADLHLSDSTHRPPPASLSR